MIRSMTGYGRGEGQQEGKKLTIELKAVNHRYSEVVVRLPKIFSPLEDGIRKKVLTCVARGRVDVFLTLETFGEQKKAIKVDKELGLAYYNALKELGAETGIPGELNLREISQLPDVLRIQDQEEDLEALAAWVDGILSNGIAALVQMRETEGHKLKEDLLEKLAKIQDISGEIALRAPNVVEEYRTRIYNRIKEILHENQPDESRLLTEVAIFADRCNIDEEIVRLKSHCKQMAANLESKEPVGRKLDFLIQEMNREINTIGSKANDLQITSLVVEAKSELEKMREQIQNIE